MARRALGPATAAAVSAVENALADSDRILLVACSGGADSLALAVAAVTVARRGLIASGLVVNHGLQGGADAVAAGALAQLAGIGLGAEALRVQVGDDGSGPEAAARTARYEVLASVARERGATVLLGHTLDDQAETVLLGLGRGSGTRSLAGMPGRRPPYLRPFLGLRRAVTEAVCAEHGLVPWVDPHNDDPAYARVRVRTRVLPVLERELGPGVAEALARTATLARDDADVLDDLAAGRRPEAEPDCATLAALPPALRRRAVRDWLRAAGATDLSATHLMAVDRLLTDWRGQRFVEVPRLRVRRVGDRLRADPASAVDGPVKG